MAGGPLARLAGSAVYRSLILASVLVGFRDSMAEPFLILFAVEKAGLRPLELGVLLTVRALGAVIFSMVFGLWLDRAPSILPLTLALALGAIGFVLLSQTTDFHVLLLVAAVPLAAGMAAFPQLFALAKGHLDQTGGTAAERGIAVMRASFSAAWAIGPVLGAALVEAFDYHGMFVASAACGVTAYVSLVWSGLKAPSRARRPEGSAVALSAHLGIGICAAGFTLFYVAMVMGSVALPIVVTRDLGGPNSAVGATAATCAFLEVPVMIAVALRPATLGGYGGLVAGFVGMGIYFLAVTFAPTVPLVIAAQALRAVGIGLVTCVGISYMQDLMPNRAGAAAALFTITGQLGALFAGLAAGTWADFFGYRSMFLACAALCGMGLVLLSLGARPQR